MDNRYYLISSCNSEDKLTFAIIELTGSETRELRRAFYALETIRNTICGPSVCLTSINMSIHSNSLKPDVKDYEELTDKQLERLHTSIGESPPDTWIQDIDPVFAQFLRPCESLEVMECRMVATTLGVYFELDVDCGPVPSHDVNRDVQEMFTHPIPWELIREWADRV